MGWRISKRIKLFNGLGLNIGKQGVSISLRTPFGSIGAKGASIRTGIPGVQYRVPFHNPNPQHTSIRSVVLPSKYYKVELSDGTSKFMSASAIASSTNKSISEIESLYQNAEYIVK